MIWNGKKIETVRDLFDAVHGCETRQQADEFMAAYRGEREHADANVGYVIGYADEVTRERLYGLFQVGHPITGTAV